MEEQENVSRRDSVAGLSLLGTLTIVLALTIFYRIVESAPKKGPPPARPVLVDVDQNGSLMGSETWVDPATFANAPSRPAATMAAGETQLVNPNSDVQRASHNDSSQARTATPDSRPRFIAPNAQ